MVDDNMIQLIENIQQCNHKLAYLPDGGLKWMNSDESINHFMIISNNSHHDISSDYLLDCDSQYIQLSELTQTGLYRVSSFKYRVNFSSYIYGQKVTFFINMKTAVVIIQISIRFKLCILNRFLGIIVM